jgi:putative addiction module killer protein
MPEIRRTSEFARWLDALADSRARAAILVRIDRLALGNAGDSKPVGGGVSELRIDVGPGYRVYFTRIATTVLLLIAGGDKSTQPADIRRAVDFVRTLRGRRAK